jgi:HEPN domain-containing protein
MPPEALRLADTRGWFEKVAEDLYSAQIGLAAKPPALGDVLFHSQQAVEKALKGFLTWHDRQFRETHDLRELREQCLEVDGTLALVLHPILGLTEYAWALRYPGEPVRPSRKETEEGLALAREVLQAILSRLPAEVRP